MTDGRCKSETLDLHLILLISGLYFTVAEVIPRRNYAGPDSLSGRFATLSGATVCDGTTCSEEGLDTGTGL